MQAYDLYVGIGDSISIDRYAGAPGLGACSLLYRNQDARWPQFHGLDLHTLNPATPFVLLAEDGLHSQQLQTRVLPRLPPPRPRTLATLTIGGNDLLFWVSQNLPSPPLEQFGQTLDHVLRHLRSLFGGATLLIANVYDPTDGTGRMQSGNERFRSGFPLLHQMNALLARKAAEFSAHLVDVYSHFLGHGSDHANPHGAHYHPDDPSCWVMYDIEPNARGASELRRLFWSTLP